MTDVELPAPGIVPDMLSFPDCIDVLRDRLGLTHTEALTVMAVVTGATDAQIATRRQCATSTVKAHLRAVLAKLQVRGRTAIAARAVAELHRSRMPCPH